MSYARFAEGSDVYVFASVHGNIECCSCQIKGSGACSTFETTDAMIAHLREHEAAGHDVPSEAYEGLERDCEDNDAFAAHVKAGGTYESYK